MNIAGVAGYIDATMIKVADGLALTAGTVQCFAQRKSDSKWLYADTTWDAVEPVGANIPTMTHWKGGEWRLAHTPAAANDVYTINCVDSPVTCYPDNRVEHVRLPGAEDATVAKDAAVAKEATLAAIAAYVDTEVAAILAAIVDGTNGLAAIKTAIDDERYGKWSLDPTNKVLTKYAQDGVTALKIFDLTSYSGSVPAFVGRTPR